MAAENPLPDERGAGASPRAVASGFAVALIIIALVAVLGWLHTVRELNRIVAHEVVRGEVLRQARLAHAKAHASADKLKQQQLSRRQAGGDED